MPMKNQSIGEKLLQSIYDNPADNEMRLVYADYLLERDNPRGEFIILQYELEKTKKNKDKEKSKQLKAQIKEIWNKHWQEFTYADLNIDYLNKRSFIYVKGFPYKIILAPSQAKKRIGKFYITEFSTNEKNRILSAQGYKTIKEFQFSHLRYINNTNSPHIIIDLFQNNLLSSLEILNLSDSWLVGTDIKQLAECQQLNNLKNLNLSSNQITDSELEHLINSKYLEGLTDLNISNNDLSYEGIKNLIISKNFPNLEYLNVTENDMYIREAEDIRFRCNIRSQMRGKNFKIELTVNNYGMPYNEKWISSNTGEEF